MQIIKICSTPNYWHLIFKGPSIIDVSSQVSIDLAKRFQSRRSKCEKLTDAWQRMVTQALVSFKKYMPPPLPYFKVNICHYPLLHFASIFFAYLWSFRWPNYIITLPRYVSFQLPHLNIPTGLPSDELDKHIQRTSLCLLFSHWNGYNHFQSGLNWFRE